MNITMVSDLLETLMIIGFGISWPFSIYKSYVSRTAKGKACSLNFLYGWDTYLGLQGSFFYTIMQPLLMTGCSSCPGSSMC